MAVVAVVVLVVAVGPGVLRISPLMLPWPLLLLGSFGLVWAVWCMVPTRSPPVVVAVGGCSRRPYACVNDRPVSADNNVG